MSYFLTDDERALLPDPYEAIAQGDQALCRVRLFVPDTRWSWYILGYSPDDDLCYGLVSGYEVETGYFSLRELADIPWTLRDPHWQTATLAEVRARVLAEQILPAGDGPAVVDFTRFKPDETKGGMFGRCPLCRRVGRIMEVPGGRHYVHRQEAIARGVYETTDRCRVQYEPRSAS